MPSSFNQPDIPTISKTAPPSYAEAMAQIATKDNSYAGPYGQPASTTTTTTTSMYNQACSQIPGYPSTVPANNFYSNIPSQPAYNPSYVPVESNQQCHRATTAAIVRIEPIRERPNVCCDGCTKCSKRAVIAILFTCLIIYLIKVVVSLY